MKVTHLSTLDTQDPDVWSGTQVWISKALRNAGVSLCDLNITKMEMMLPPLEELAFQAKRWWLRVTKGLQVSPELNYARWASLAEGINGRVKNSRPDVILTSLTSFAGALLDTSTPMVHWTDAPHSSLLGFYPEFCFHDSSSLWESRLLTNLCLK